MNYGVVIFEEGRATSGIASINGGPERRINSIGDLDSNVFWLTSLSYSDFYACGLSRHPNVRNCEYLRTPMDQLMDEVGLKKRFADTAESIRAISEIFSKVMMMSESMYGVTSFKKDKLADDIRDFMLPEDHSYSQELDGACEMAYQTYTKCVVNANKGSKSVQFRLPRIEHANNVLSTPVPGSQWEFLDRKQLPESKDRVNWIVNNQQPILAKVNISDVSKDVANIIAFGSGSSNFRSWVTQPEFIFLSRYAKIQVECAFIFDEYVDIGARIQVPKAKGFPSISLSSGLLAENYWIGLANPQIKYGGLKLHSPRAAWLRAVDRIHCFMPALYAHTCGVQVRSYGIGAVALEVPRGNMADVIDVAIKAGLVPPMALPEDVKIQGALA